jgi:AcrR family transcriptional regulator
MPFVSSELPPAPGRRPRPAPRRTLSQEAIVDAALAVLDERGVAALSMRAVADRLGTGPASLYAHVENKEEMLGLLIDRVALTIPRPVVGAAPWQDQLKDVIRNIRASFAAHRDLAQANLGTIPTGPNALALMDAMMGVLRDAGIPGQIIAYAVDILPLYATATAYEESLHAAKDDAATVEEFVAQLQGFFKALPADRFPNFVALAEELTAGAGDERFEFGLEALVRGIESMAATS